MVKIIFNENDDQERSSDSLGLYKLPIFVCKSTYFLLESPSSYLKFSVI